MANDLTGVILAGGRSTRMGGGDKCLRDLGGQTVLSHIVGRARPQVGALILNANGEAGRFDGFGLPTVGDSVEGFAGPLAGVLAGLDWAAANRPDDRWVASFASDAPFVPSDLVERLMAPVRRGDAELACARSGGQAHPVFGVWPVALRQALRSAIVDEKIHKVDRWTGRYRLIAVDFPVEPFDPFFNVNDPDDLDTARKMVLNASA